MLARAAVVCALVCWASSAFAEDAVRRPVAVIEVAANDQDLGQLAGDFVNALNIHPELLPLVDDAGQTLHDQFSDEDADARLTATRLLKEAGEALDGFDSKLARDKAIEGQGNLYPVTPVKAAHLYAELALVLGQARLGLRDSKGAAEAFVLVHALVPGRELEPAHYLPEVVAAFDKAKVPTTTGKLEVNGTGELWIDGHKVGDVQDKGTFDVPVGIHLVQLDGFERLTMGLEVTVVPDDPKAPKLAIATIADAPLPDVVRLHRLRMLIATAPDPLVRAGAVSKIAELVSVKDAILLSRDADGAIQYETWKDDTFTPPAPLGDTPPATILDKIEPPKPKIVAVKRKEYPIPLPKHETEWYLRPKYYGPAIGIVVGIVAAGFLITRGEGTVQKPEGPLAGIPGTHW